MHPAGRTPLSQVNPNLQPRMSMATGASLVIQKGQSSSKSSTSSVASRKSIGSAINASFGNPSTAPRQSLAVAPKAVMQVGRPSIAPTGRPSIAPTGRPSMAPTGRPSMAPVSRMGAYTSSGARAEVRPISDKSYMRQSIMMIIKYLAEHNYDRPISIKILEQPSAKDYFAIVQFLYSQFDPCFKFSDKPEEDILIIFRNLKYPFSITKSSLKSVGSQHAWPGLLATITWLVELLMYEEDLMSKEVNYTAETDNAEKLFFEYLAKAYYHFLSGEDNYTALDEEISNQFRSRNHQVQMEIESLSNANQVLEHEINDLKIKGNRVGLLEHQKIDLLSDCGKLSEFVNRLESHNNNLQQIQIELDSEYSSKINMIAQLEAERAHLKSTLEHQELQPSDVERMNKDRNQLSELIQSVSGNKHQLQQHQWNTEMQISKKLEEIEERVSQYNTMAMRMKIIPLGAKKSQSIGCEIRLNTNATSHLEFFGMDLKQGGDIRSLLVKLREEYQQKYLRIENEKFQHRVELNVLEEQLNDLQRISNDLHQQTQLKERNLQVEKEMFDEETRLLTSEQNSLQIQIEHLKQSKANDLKNSTRTLELVSQQYEQLQRSSKLEKDEFNQRLINSLSLLMNHRTYIQQTLSLVAKHVDESKTTSTNAFD